MNEEFADQIEQVAAKVDLPSHVIVSDIVGETVDYDYEDKPTSDEQETDEYELVEGDFEAEQAEVYVTSHVLAQLVPIRLQLSWKSTFPIASYSILSSPLLF